MGISSSVRFLHNHTYNRLLNPKIKKPTFAYIAIETVCNSRCGYCDMWKTKKGNQPNKEEWKRIIDDIHELGAVTLTFSGGEPFINKDLFELAKYAKSIGLVTMVVTNLSLFKEDNIPKIAESFDFFSTSIDSSRADVYSETRGVDWLEKNKINIKKITSGLAKLKAGTAVCAMVTISNRNADHMHEILHMVFDELNMDTISFNLLDPQGGVDARRFEPTTEQIENYKKVILDHKSYYPIMNSARYLQETGNFDYKCNPWKCIQIDHEGILVSPCLFINGGRFDLRKTRLSDAWKNEDMQVIYEKYSSCNKCNLGCVAEAAWSTYDMGFNINENLRGMILPTIRRIKMRNKGVTKKMKCDFTYKTEPHIRSQILA